MSFLMNTVLIFLPISVVYTCYVSQNSNYTIVLNKVDVNVYQLTSNRKPCSNIIGTFSGFCSNVYCEISITNFNLNNKITRIFTDSYDKRLNTTGVVCQIKTTADINANKIYLPRRRKSYYSNIIFLQKDVYVWEYKVDNYLKLYQDSVIEWKPVYRRSKKRILEFTSRNVTYSLKISSNNSTADRKFLVFKSTDASKFVHMNLTFYLRNLTSLTIKKCQKALTSSHKQPKELVSPLDVTLSLQYYSSLKQVTSTEDELSVIGSSNIEEEVTIQYGSTTKKVYRTPLESSNGSKTQLNTEKPNQLTMCNESSTLPKSPKENIGCECELRFYLILLIFVFVVWLIAMVLCIWYIAFTRKNNNVDNVKATYSQRLRSSIVVKYFLPKKDDEEEITIFERRPYCMEHVSEGNFI